MRRAHLKEVLLTEPADLTIYRYREFVPRNVEIVADPRGLFRKLYGSELEAGRLLQDENVQEFIKILSDMNCILHSYALYGGDYMSRITCYNDLFNTYRWYTI